MTIQWIAESPDRTSGSGENIRLCIDATGKAHLAYTESNRLTYAIGSPGQFFLVLTGGSAEMTISTGAP